MAYRKRIKIMKGLSLNISGSGLSLNAGVRGASATFGKNGTYLNTGIPGTGLYNRSKIDSHSNTSISRLQNQHGNIDVNIGLDTKGFPILNLIGDNGLPITDESVIRKIKKSDKYKQAIEGLIESKKNKIDEETDKFINIFKYTPEIISEERIKNELANLKTEIYLPKDYNVQEPQLQSVQQELELRAKQTINKIFFWKNKSLRKSYVNQNIETLYNEKMEVWIENKNSFNENEKSIKKNKDVAFFNEYTNIKTQLENILNGNNVYIENKIEALINEIILPVEFTVEYEYITELKQLKIDLDLPEIEDMPQEKASILSTGKISIKNKSQKELKQEYSQCVSGIAFFLAGTFFNISPRIEEIIISGFSQRINKVNGKIENQYIYSIRFTREKLSSINYKNIDSLVAFSNFENNMKVLNDYEFKTIEPLQ